MANNYEYAFPCSLLQHAAHFAKLSEVSQIANKTIYSNTFNLQIVLWRINSVINKILNERITLNIVFLFAPAMFNIFFWHGNIIFNWLYWTNWSKHQRVVNGLKFTEKQFFPISCTYFEPSSWFLASTISLKIILASSTTTETNFKKFTGFLLKISFDIK